MNKLKKRLIRLLPLSLALVVTVLASGGALYMVRSFMNQPVAPPKQTIQEVRLIRPPPPPPEEVEPPPPPEVEEEVDVPEPETPDEALADDLPPASDLLGLDAEGVAGTDGFGLAARPGGRSLLASGSGGRFDWYAGVLKNDLLSFLADYEELRRRAYQVELRLWLDADGGVERVVLDKSTGNLELDEELRTRLASLERVAEAPPADLPQPIQIRIVSRL